MLISAARYEKITDSKTIARTACTTMVLKMARVHRDSPNYAMFRTLWQYQPLLLFVSYNS